MKSFIENLNKNENVRDKYIDATKKIFRWWKKHRKVNNKRSKFNSVEAIEKIQKWFRRRKRVFSDINNIANTDAAVIIQRNWRNYVVCKNILFNVLEEECARIIQIWYRKTKWKKRSKKLLKELILLKYELKCKNVFYTNLQRDIQLIRQVIT